MCKRKIVQESVESRPSFPAFVRWMLEQGYAEDQERLDPLKLCQSSLNHYEEEVRIKNLAYTLAHLGGLWYTIVGALWIDTFDN